MLDILHKSDTAIVRGAGTWDGGGRVLAGGIDAENAVGEIRLLEASTGFGGGGSGSPIR